MQITFENTCLISPFLLLSNRVNELGFKTPDGNIPSAAYTVYFSRLLTGRYVTMQRETDNEHIEAYEVDILVASETSTECIAGF